MKFIKMHGCGNDYIYLDAVTTPTIETMIDRPDWPALVRGMSDRHKGVGSDGVIVVCDPTQRARREHAHVRMRMFNADGSESEMCGNGVRCVAKLAHDRLGIRPRPMLIETGRGVLSIAYEVDDGRLSRATVDMGEPILDLAAIPVDSKHLKPAGTRHSHAWFIEGFKGGSWTFVSMGNPHAVLVSGDVGEGEGSSRGVAKGRLEEWGEAIEKHPAFPRRTNVHFLKNISRGRVELVTWERGAGITQACGTGACAALVACVVTGQMDREAMIRVLGGELHVRWDEPTSHVFMTGEAAEVFSGEWPVDLMP